MDYNHSVIQDYLNNDDFIRWVLHSENDAHWQRIMSVYPHQQILIDQARQIVMQLHEAEKQTSLPAREDHAWEVIRETINTPESQPVISLSERSSRSLWQTPIFRWAAMLVCMLGVGWFAVNYQKQRSFRYTDLVARAEQDKKLVERVNTADQPLPIRLETVALLPWRKTHA